MNFFTIQFFNYSQIKTQLNLKYRNLNKMLLESGWDRRFPIP